MNSPLVRATPSVLTLGILLSFCVLSTPGFAERRQGGEQVGLFWLDVENPDPIHVKFTFKVANLSGMLAPNVPAPFLDTSAYIFTHRPAFSIPSPTPESKSGTYLPASLGAWFAAPQTINAGEFDHTMLTETSIHPDHIAHLIQVLNDDLNVRATLLNEFSAQQQEVMKAVLKGLSPVPLDWESGLTKLLNIWLPGSEATVMMTDVGITFGAMQNTLWSLEVLQPQINRLAEITEEQALQVWLPYGDARLAGTIPEIPDPGISSFLALGPKGGVTNGATSPIIVIPDEVPTLVLLAGPALLLAAAGTLRRTRARA